MLVVGLLAPTAALAASAHGPAPFCKANASLIGAGQDVMRELLCSRGVVGQL